MRTITSHLPMLPAGKEHKTRSETAKKNKMTSSAVSYKTGLKTN